VKKIVVLDGAFFVLGNVNPAAEANVSCRILFMFSAIRKRLHRLVSFRLFH
jgi:hypothetical protein